MRKTSIAVIVIIVIFCGAACRITVERFKKGVTYKGYDLYLENGEITLTGYHGLQEELIIPERVLLWPVRKLGRGHTREGFRALSPSVKKVIIPDSITEIDSAFNECEGLREVELPKTIDRMIESFNQCINLETINGGEKIQIIYSCFRGEEKWMETLPDKDLIVFRDILLSYEGKEKELIIPEGIRVIDTSACYDNEALESVVIPDTVRIISGDAFHKCSNLRSITIGDNLELLGGRIFSETAWMERNKEDMVIIGNALLQYNGQEEILIVPEEIGCIAPDALQDNKYCKRIVVPDSVGYVGPIDTGRSDGMELVILGSETVIVSMTPNMTDVIYAHKGSLAWEYAKKNGLEVHEVDEIK